MVWCKSTNPWNSKKEFFAKSNNIFVDFFYFFFLPINMYNPFLCGWHWVELYDKAGHSFLLFIQRVISTCIKNRVSQRYFLTSQHLLLCQSFVSCSSDPHYDVVTDIFYYVSSRPHQGYSGICFKPIESHYVSDFK